MIIKKSDIKKGYSIKLETIGRENRVLETTEHLVSGDSKGLFIERKGFKLYISKIHDSNRFTKIKQ